jgi:hypothetical protein
VPESPGKPDVIVENRAIILTADFGHLRSVHRPRASVSVEVSDGFGLFRVGYPHSQCRHQLLDLGQRLGNAERPELKADESGKLTGRNAAHSQRPAGKRGGFRVEFKAMGGEEDRAIYRGDRVKSLR